MSEPKLSAHDCYSENERGTMLAWQNMRSASLAPTLAWLTRMRITADHLTWASLVLGVIAAALLPFAPWPAMWTLLAHATLDGLDGPLARHQGTSGPKGSANDTFCDQIVITGITAALMYIHGISILAGSVYMTSYVTVVLFAMILNALNKPYKWVIRPRFVIYMCIPFGVYGPFWVLETTFWVCNALLFYKTVTGFIDIRDTLEVRA